MYLIRYYQPDKDSMLFFQVTYDINSSKGVEEERGAQTSFAFSDVVHDDDDDDVVDDDEQLCTFLKPISPLLVHFVPSQCIINPIDNPSNQTDPVPG